jgi:cell division protein ZapA (FtsZ GTPase activity inhibitor)
LIDFVAITLIHELQALDEKIKQREDQFANMFAAQQKQMMAQFDLLEQKLKMDKNEVWG